MKPLERPKIHQHPRCLHPRKVVEVLNQELPDHAVQYVDIGNVTAWMIRHGKRNHPGTFFTDTVSGSMDYAIPAAIGGKLARPDAPVFAVVGDGGALMGSILDVFRAVEERLPICVIVFNDGGWGMLEHGIRQSALRDAPRPSFRFGRRVDFALLARSLHARGIRAANVPELRRALRECLGARAPIVVDVIVDGRAVPPIGGRTGHVNQHTQAETPGRTSRR